MTVQSVKASVGCLQFTLFLLFFSIYLVLSTCCGFVSQPGHYQVTR